jgi:hypothetical protein
LYRLKIKNNQAALIMNSNFYLTPILPAEWERLSPDIGEAPHLIFEVLLHHGEGFRMRYYQ